MTTANLAQHVVASPSTTPAPFSLFGMLKHMVPSLLESSIPFVTYSLVKSTLHTSDLVALTIGALIPATLSIIRFARSRSIDIINLLIVLGIVGSILAALIGGDARLLLIRESAVGGLFGLAFLISLFRPRPLCFYLVRHVRAGRDAQRVAAFNEQWQHPQVRRTYRFLTVLWGLGSVGEFALRVLMIFTLSIPMVLAISAVTFPAITMVLAAISMWSLYRLQRMLKPAIA